MEKIQQYLSENPAWAGVLISAFGIFLLLASVFDWNWIFGDVSSVNYSPGKIDGLVNLFGRKITRLICGIIGIAVFFGGAFWIWIYIRK